MLTKNKIDNLFQKGESDVVVAVVVVVVVIGVLVVVCVMGEGNRSSIWLPSDKGDTRLCWTVRNREVKKKKKSSVSPQITS